MNATMRILIALVVIGLGAALYFNRPASEAPAEEAGQIVNNDLPKLVDLGADKCVPCKMMAPILEEMKVEFAGTFSVEFIDVWKFPDAAVPYNIKVIPTQIFFSSTGEELFRHEGFFSREDILAKWDELGVEIEAI